MRIEQEATDRLRAARSQQPHPLHARAGEVARYVEELQAADTALHAAGIHATSAGLAAEVAMLHLKRASIDAAIRRQVELAARRAGSNRSEAIDTMKRLFKLGHTPEPPLEGRYQGQLATPTLFSPLDTFGRFFARLWMPWKGKRFNAEVATGINIFDSSVQLAGRLYWPTFSDYQPYRPGLVTAFRFRTRVGEGVQDPGIRTLKLDYDLPTNPRFLVRSVLDEVVQMSGNYYLGKAYLRDSRGGYRLAAFFALERKGD